MAPPITISSLTKSSWPLWVALVAVGVAWGSTAPLSKLVVSTGHHPVGVTFWTTAISAIVFNAILYVRGGRLTFERRHVGFFLICGFFGTVLPNTVSYEAYRHLPVGVMALCFAFIPMATVLLSVPLGLEQMNARRFLGITLGAVAMIPIAFPDASLPEAGQAIWITLPVIAAVSYAAENVYIAKTKPNGSGPLHIMSGLSLGALVMLTPATFALGASFDITILRPQELAVLGIAALHIIAYFGYVWLIGHAGSVFASQVSYIVTGSGVFLGVAFYKEQHSLWIWAALGLMFLGLSLVQPRAPYREH